MGSDQRESQSWGPRWGSEASSGGKEERGLWLVSFYRISTHTESSYLKGQGVCPVCADGWESLTRGGNLNSHGERGLVGYVAPSTRSWQLRKAGLRSQELPSLLSTPFPTFVPGSSCSGVAAFQSDIRARGIGVEATASLSGFSRVWARHITLSLVHDVY